MNDTSTFHCAIRKHLRLDIGGEREEERERESVCVCVCKIYKDRKVYGVQAFDPVDE